jgi:hypothetical protein
VAISILSRIISSVAVIDDQPEVRRSYGYTIQNLDLNPLPQIGPLGTSAHAYISTSSLTVEADAAICDYKLSGRAYASFTGADLVAQLYHNQLPALLCTRYETAAIQNITPYRRWIPVLLAPGDLNEESLIKGLHECIYELEGNLRVHRRPWRALIHFLSEDEDYPGIYFAEVAGWELDDIIKIRASDLPPVIRQQVAPDFRCFAKVNLGAESYIDLYLDEWELP